MVQDLKCRGDTAEHCGEKQTHLRRVENRGDVQWAIQVSFCAERMSSFKPPWAVIQKQARFFPK